MRAKKAHGDPRERQVEEFLYTKSNRYHTSLMRGRHPRSFPQQSDLWTFVKRSEQRKARLVSGSKLVGVVEDCSVELDPVDMQILANVIAQLKATLGGASASVVDLRSLGDVLDDVLAIMPSSTSCSTQHLHASTFKKISGRVTIYAELRKELAHFHRVLVGRHGAAAFSAAAARRGSGCGDSDGDGDGAERESSSRRPSSSSAADAARAELRHNNLPFGVTRGRLNEVMEGGKVANPRADGTHDRVVAQLNVLARRQAAADAAAEGGRTAREKTRSRGVNNRRGSSVSRVIRRVSVRDHGVDRGRRLSHTGRRPSHSALMVDTVQEVVEKKMARKRSGAASEHGHARRASAGPGDDDDLESPWSIEPDEEGDDVIMPLGAAPSRTNTAGTDRSEASFRSISRSPSRASLARSGTALVTAGSMASALSGASPEEESNAYTKPIIEDDPTVNIYFGAIVALQRSFGHGGDPLTADSTWLSLVDHGFWKKTKGYVNVSRTVKVPLRAHAAVTTPKKSGSAAGGRRGSRMSGATSTSAAPSDGGGETRNEGEHSLPWSDSGCLAKPWGAASQANFGQPRTPKRREERGAPSSLEPEKMVQMFKLINMKDQNDTGLVHYDDDIWLVPVLPHMSWMLTATGTEHSPADTGSDGWGCVLGAHVVQGAVISSVASAVGDDQTGSESPSRSSSPTARSAPDDDSAAGAPSVEEGSASEAQAIAAAARAKLKAARRRQFGEARTFMSYMPTTMNAEEYVNDGNGPLRKKRMSRMASAMNDRATRIGRWRIRSAAEDVDVPPGAKMEVQNMARVVLEHGWLSMCDDHGTVVMRQPDVADSAARANQGIWTIRVIRTGSKGKGKLLQRENVLNAARDKLRESAALRSGSKKHLVVKTTRGTDVALNSGRSFAVNMRMIRQEAVIRQDKPMLNNESKTIASLATHLGTVQQRQTAKFARQKKRADARRADAKRKSMARHGEEPSVFAQLNAKAAFNLLHPPPAASGQRTKITRRQTVAVPVFAMNRSPIQGKSRMARSGSSTMLPSMVSSTGSASSGEGRGRRRRTSFAMATVTAKAMAADKKTKISNFQWLKSEKKPENSLCAMLCVFVCARALLSKRACCKRGASRSLCAHPLTRALPTHAALCPFTH